MESGYLRGFATRVLACVLSLSAAVVSTARADDNYEATIDAALVEYKAGNWEEARAMFLRAHQIRPNARTLRGMGLSDFEGRHYVRSLEALKASLKETRQPLTDKQRTSVKELIERAKLYVGKLVLEVEPAGAKVRLDGRVVEPDDEGAIVVDPGSYELRVTAPDHERQTLRVSVQAGETNELRVALLPLDGDPGPGVDASPAEAADSEGGGRVWTWVAAGSAVVFGGAAVGFWMAGDSELSDLEAECMRVACSDRQQVVDDSSLGTLDTLATVSLALAATSAVAATVLFFVEGSEDVEPAAAAPVQLGITPRGIAVAGRF